MKLWDLDHKKSKKSSDSIEGLYVRGRKDKRDSNHSRSKSRGYICNKKGHVKRNCSNQINKSVGKDTSTNKSNIAEDDYKSSKVLSISSSGTQCEWVIDSDYSFHMCSKIEWFDELIKFIVEKYY